MKLTNSQIHIIFQVLARVEPMETKAPYDLSGKVRYNIARNMRRLKEAMDDVEAVRQKFVKERLKPGENELTGDAVREFETFMAEVMAQEADIPIFQVTTAELNLDKNRIPFYLLSELIGNVVKDEESADKAV